MNGFELESWHLMALFGTMVLSIFKDDISSAIKSTIMIHEQKKNVGKKILLLTATGEWTPATIQRYQHEIPFVRGGGVFVKYDEPVDGYDEEKMSFSTWQSQRFLVA